MTQLLNVQNDRTYAPSAYKKSSIENKRLYVERSGFSISLMVSVAVSKVGKSSKDWFKYARDRDDSRRNREKSNKTIFG